MRITDIITLFLAAATVFCLPSCNKDKVISDPRENYRPPTAASSATATAVFEYTPAPGQFINENMEATTPAAAAGWAEKRLDGGLFVSLGGFGGYIVVGFDHSILSSGGDYDFGVAGNSFFNASTGTGGSNEPGIVFVMQDTNGNGLPDDGWHELKGSEYGSDNVIQNYSITYYKPAEVKSDVKWTDNQGGNGAIDYLGAFHRQDSYYPAWISADSYTLSGPCLRPKNSQDEAGLWNNDAYGHGYADNMGADNTAHGRFQQCNRFRIADAVNADGTPADLDFIDFVKIQCAVNAKSGILGEVSTEVCGVVDLNL